MHEIAPKSFEFQNKRCTENPKDASKMSCPELFHRHFFKPFKAYFKHELQNVKYKPFSSPRSCRHRHAKKRSSLECGKLLLIFLPLTADDKQTNTRAQPWYAHISLGKARAEPTKSSLYESLEPSDRPATHAPPLFRGYGLSEVERKPHLKFRDNHLQKFPWNPRKFSPVADGLTEDSSLESSQRFSEMLRGFQMLSA